MYLEEKKKINNNYLVCLVTIQIAVLVLNFFNSGLWSKISIRVLMNSSFLLAEANEELYQTDSKGLFRTVTKLKVELRREGLECGVRMV